MRQISEARAASRRRAWRSCILMPLVLAMTAELALAQERYERRSVLDFFFGRRYLREDDAYPPPPSETMRPDRPRRRAPAKAPAAAPRPAVAPPPQVEETRKLDDAKKILVIGDFLAGGLADGLDAAFKDSPGVVVEARTNIASGLVRDDYYNWRTQLPKFLDETKPVMVVVMLGANDRQQMATDAAKEKFRTEGWFQEYRNRVDALGKTVRARDIPLLWVGMPAFASATMTADAVQMNQLYRKEMEALGGEYIDVWDGFVDENGGFIVTGSDVNGQQSRLRAADGVNLTPAGRRKLAFYVEKPARRILGTQASPDLIRLDTDAAPSTEGADRTQPIALNDPALDGGTELLGASAATIRPAPAATKSPRDLLVEGAPLPDAPEGRVDDYRLSSLPKREATASTPTKP